MKIKRATKKNLNFIEKLLKKNELPYEDVYLKLNSLFLAHINSKKIGIGGIEIYGDSGLLRSLVIEKPFRKKGYGTELCLKVIKYAQLKGVKNIYLLTTTAENFFKKIGFETTERKVAPRAIQETSEFVKLCPETATCMRMRAGA